MKTADLVLRDNGRCDIPHATYSRVERCYALKKIMNPNPKGPENVNILTYRNNPSNIGIVILIFPSVFSNAALRVQAHIVIRKKFIFSYNGLVIQIHVFSWLLSA